jgi:diaminohydroxyphosphoribosylaminopyrimidine deaminase/5-amino-6-(5-phosphoribosylamino)uracil reductase
MSNHSTDEQLLYHALDLARQSIGLASPNPHVGALLVDPQGAIVGTGVYTYAGVKHAEVRALEHAGEKARGATLYINLEPHSHHGRTPPCTDALIAAGIRRVVASMPDPNPKVSGQGFEKLRAAGIQVEVGLLAAQARQLNDAFARYIRHQIPLVTLKAAMTLDGMIAPPPQQQPSRIPGIPAGGWITGEAARAHVHQLRHQNDAILAGIGTILADDPLLTDRTGIPRRRPLLRVILDSHLRLPVESRLVQSAANDILVFCSSADERQKHQLEALGIRIEQLAPAADGHPEIHSVLRRLGQLEITSLMIEGGSTVNGMSLRCGIADKVFLFYAPKISASPRSTPFSSDSDSKSAGPIREVSQLRVHQFGEDFGVEGYLRDPYSE